MDPDELDPIDPDTSGGNGDREDHEDDDDRQQLLAASGIGETIPLTERRTTTSTSYREHSSPGTTEQAETSFIEGDLNERA